MEKSVKNPSLENSPDMSNQTIEGLCEKVLAYYPEADVALIKEAYEYAKEAHEGQFRKSGEPYITHPLGVSYILADLKLDIESILTGLLHDTVEDTEVTSADINQKFGNEVEHLVDGVTKITQMSFKHTHEKQGENIRKMIVAMGKDVRVVLVKLADRLHNMRTMTHMKFEKQEKKSRETLDIYAPLASRLGINWLKIELEDLSFRYAKPDVYYALAEKVQRKRSERDQYILDVIGVLEKEIKLRTQVDPSIHGRSKHLYSICKKMEARDLDYDQIYDVLAFRVLVDNISQCYEVLGLVHSLWKPIPGRFKDFIAMPKANNYRSLHTTVIGPGGDRIEIQIRTKEMHLIAEQGIAAHWKYKEVGRGHQIDPAAMGQFSWLRDMVAIHQQTSSSDEFLENVKTELFDSEIYVFTPKGDVIEFPDGATAIDFAYSVHTEVGNKCTGAKFNGKIVPLREEMKNGDSVEIITSNHQTPSKDWLKFCVTSRAKSKIRNYVRQEERKRAYEIGKGYTEKAFRKFGKATSKYLKGPIFEGYLQENSCKNLEEYYILVGYGKINPKNTLEFLSPDVLAKEKKEIVQTDNYFKKALQGAFNKSKKSSSLIQVDGMDDILVHFAKCCMPIPGDSISGLVTRGRGIVVHRADCEKLFSTDQDRRVDVTWSVNQNLVDRIVRIRILSLDTPGLLVSMSEIFTSKGANIYNAQIRTNRDNKAICTFDVSVKNTSQLSDILKELQKIKDVLNVSRITQV